MDQQGAQLHSDMRDAQDTTTPMGGQHAQQTQLSKTATHSTGCHASLVKLLALQLHALGPHDTLSMLGSSRQTLMRGAVCVGTLAVLRGSAGDVVSQPCMQLRTHLCPTHVAAAPSLYHLTTKTNEGSAKACTPEQDKHRPALAQALPPLFSHRAEQQPTSACKSNLLLGVGEQTAHPTVHVERAVQTTAMWSRAPTL
jgi:hypothetical protein